MQRKSGRVCREDDFAFIHARKVSCLLVEFGIVALYIFAFLCDTVVTLRVSSGLF